MLTWTETPEIKLGTNTFRNVPVILQYEDTPLIEVVQVFSSTYGIKTPIFDSSGELMAVLEGARLSETDAGKRAGILKREMQDVTAFELAGRTILEARRNGAKATALEAELHAPDGRLVRSNTGGDVLCDPEGIAELVKGMMTNCSFSNVRIGVWIKDNGILIGCS